MYSFLKKLLAFLTVTAICLTGFLFFQEYGNEMFAGYREVISVEKSTVDFADKLEEIVQENHLVLARRIVEASEDGKGKSKNTYLPIGADSLPSQFPIQSDKKLIENSSYNTVYVIVSGDLQASDLAEKLTKDNNIVRVLQTSYELTFLRLMLATPQSFLILFSLLVGYASLILTEQISAIREVGIKRISGYSKHGIALHQAMKDSRFLGVLTLVFLLVVGLGLAFVDGLSLTAFLLISIPILFWIFLLLALNFFLSNLFYYLLQQQPLIFSIKGKAPVTLFFLVLIVTLMVTLTSVLYCSSGVLTLNKQLDTLNEGRKRWEQASDFYEITSLEDGGVITKEQRTAFFQDLSNEAAILYRVDMLDNIAMSESEEQVNYLPIPEMISNLIYVNEYFIQQSGLNLSNHILNKISQLKHHDKLILIPESKKEDFDKLAAAWIKFEESGFSTTEVENAKIYSEAIVEAVEYGGGRVFTYPVFSRIGQLLSNESFVSDPIIVVENPIYEEKPMSELLVNHSTKVVELIKKHDVTAGYGSLVNGLYAIQKKIQDTVTKRSLLLSAVVLSIFSSILLCSLVNTVYFYQGRRVHFIERLAGRSLICIHRLYLSVISFSCLATELLLLLQQLDAILLIIPLVYLFVVLLLFFWQMQSEKQANILYLKGE